MTVKERESNIELARIVAMAMIVIWHFIVHGIFHEGMPVTYAVSGPLPSRSLIPLLISFLVIPGSDIFVMISGYFRIKLKWKSVISLWLMCAFYNLVNVFVNGPVNASTILHAFIISSCGHWFFKAYFWLLLASPILNKAIDNFTSRELRITVIIGFVLTCISGWYFGNDNVNGYNALNFFFLYILGAFIDKENIRERISTKKIVVFYIATIIAAIAFFFIFYYVRKFGIASDALALLNHNGFFTILSAACLLCLFSKFKVNSRAVNHIASTVVAVLFLSDLVFQSQLGSFVHEKYNSLSTIGFIGVCLALIVVLFLSSFIIEGGRRLVCDPLSRTISGMMEATSKKLLK